MSRAKCFFLPLQTAMAVRSLLPRSFSSFVMSFGDGSHGALGLPAALAGVSAAAYEPTRVTSLPTDIAVVSAGHYHSLALTNGGELWAWGRDLEAQLGRGSSSPRDSWSEPSRVVGLEQVRVRAASASGVVSAAIAEDGSLFTWGASKRGQLGLGKDVVEALAPLRVQALTGEEIAKVSFGWGHALALTKDGKLFGWGYSADGRLGYNAGTLELSPLEAAVVRGKRDISSSALEAAEKLVLDDMEKENDMPITWEPHLVAELEGIDVADIACGLDHSLILCGDGTLLSCGSNTYNQLGRVNQDLGIFPVDLPFKVNSIASGLGHSLAVCEISSSDPDDTENAIFSWGWNRSGQLGRSGQEILPAKVEGLEGETPVMTSGGRAHSAALTAAGEVWVWGCGRDGRVGLGSSVDEPEPAFLSPLEGLDVLQVVLGFDHSLVLVAAK